MLEDFCIRPADDRARFDVAPLVDRLEREPSIARVPAEVGAVRRSPRTPEWVYVVCLDEAQASRVREAVDQGRGLDPFIGSVAIIEPAADHISVYQPAPREVVDQVARLLLPLLESPWWRVFSEMGEQTRHYRDQPERLFR